MRADDAVMQGDARPRVMLVDSDPGDRAEISAALRAAEIDVVAEARSGEEALELLARTAPDIAMIDVAASPNVAALALELRAATDNGLRIIALAKPEDPDRVAELVSAGARAYVLKHKRQEVAASVRSVAAGSGLLSAEVTRPVLDEVARLYEQEKIRNDELEELVRQLQELSVTDWLTGLKNHGYFFDRLAEELDRGLRHRRPLAVIAVDIDDFKQINDTRGHAAGDRVLQEVAGIMDDTIRSADVVCRIGGEEFAMLLPETDAPGAHLVAERVRSQIAGLAITGVGKVTVSLGVASVPEHAVDRDELMEAADRALYLAKREGKNRTRIAGEVVSIGSAASARTGRMQVVDLLVRVLRLRDPDLARHATETADLAVSLGAYLALPTAKLEHLRVAALLQDVGKIGVPDRVLHKRGPLTEEEWGLIREHPKRGFELVGGLIHPEAGEAVLANHERYDGKGYPRNLEGDEIPLLARVLLVADAYTAMTMDRPFRQALLQADALEELARNAGSQFDPAVVDAMTSMIAARQDAAGSVGEPTPMADAS